MSRESSETMNQRGRSPDQFETGTRILVVEDSPSARKLIQDILLRLGVALSDLRLAGTVPEALQWYAQWRPEIIFVDLQLRPPDGETPAPSTATPAPRDHYPKSGGELAIQLLQRNPALKVVICSASDPSQSEVAELVKKGKVGAIVKPILASKVQDTLVRLGASIGPPPRGR
jgi:CheY-like chemotaxis protein